MSEENPQVLYPCPAPSTPYSHLIPSQIIATVSHFRLESGILLTDVPVAYRTWGHLNKECNNCMIICHALTGSSDVEDWWGPLMGSNLAFDLTRYFIFCANVLGSPYGTASPVSINPRTQKMWGPTFPLTTTRDDARLHHIIVQHLGVKSVAVVIGGSMGGMATLEWPLCTPSGFVRHIIPLATSARHSAWGISWGEAQRQSIYSDPKFNEGRYDLNDAPKMGLSAARMAALLTYRSRDSFEHRFGRKEQPVPSKAIVTSSSIPPSTRSTNLKQIELDKPTGIDPNTSAKILPSLTSSPSTTPPRQNSLKLFSAQGYLRYQGSKFASRFDANCYIHITLKMDAHNVDHGRKAPALENEPAGALVIAISSDGLFTMSEQQELSHHIKDAKLVTVQSPDGHDGFLLEFEQINRYILDHLKQCLPEIYSCDPVVSPLELEQLQTAKKESVFGEVEGDCVTAW